jgi:hypothetical protein
MHTITLRGLRMTPAAGSMGVAALVLLAGCTSVLDVANPNNVSASALDVSAAAPAIVSGAENLAANGLSSMYNAAIPASDEAYWVGSRDDYRLLDTGGFSAVANEYVQSGYIIVSQARWMANQAINKIEGFNTAGQLLDKQLLVRAYLNAAIVYTSIGDIYNDVAFSDRTVAGKNLGEANMVQVYDSALKWLDKAVPLAAGDLKQTTIGMRARVHHARAVWLKLNPKGTTPANPLVSDAAMVADAQAALALMSGDFRYEALTTDLNRGDGSGGGFGFEMNSRVEYTPSKDLAKIDPNSGKPTAIIAKDPVTGLVDAAAVKQMNRVLNANTPDVNNPPMAQVSAREMRLLVAENALAGGNTADFDTAINALRAMDGKAAYTGAGPTRLQLLQWERRINLIFQGRRLNDMYRFGVVDPLWLPTSTAVKTPGCFFPIPQIEIDSNKLLSGVTACK